jgi:hypothetical protein
MTKRDLFIVLIRIFGLLVTLNVVFQTFPMNLSWMVYDFSFWYLLWIISLLALVVGVFFLLIIKTDKVVSLLRLDKGFDDDRVDFGSLTSVQIVKLGIFLIGGALIIQNITPILSNLFLLFSSQVSNNYHLENMSRGSLLDLSIAAINMIAGYFMVTRFGDIAMWFTKSSNPESNNQPNGQQPTAKG